jgi:hypothetical protein
MTFLGEGQVNNKILPDFIPFDFARCLLYTFLENYWKEHRRESNGAI